jgi:manganese/iron transport system permease protein
MADLLLPFQLPFMQQAFAVALAVALPMALLSCFLVLRGWALMGDAISHAVLPGVILAYLVGLPIAIGAFIAGFVCAAGTGWLRDNSRIKEDTAMGVVFSGLFGLGLVLYASVPTTLHLSHLLFGDMLGVAWAEVGWAALAGTVIVGVVLALRADFALLVFDARHARAIGLPVQALHYGLLALVALAVVGALQAVGIILAVALLITPGATALLWVRRIGPMLALAAGLGLGSAALGVYASFWLDSAPAPTIVLVLSIAFAASLPRLRRRPPARPVDAEANDRPADPTVRSAGSARARL